MTYCSVVTVLALVGLTKKRYGHCLESFIPQITKYVVWSKTKKEPEVRDPEQTLPKQQKCNMTTLIYYPFIVENA